MNQKTNILRLKYLSKRDNVGFHFLCGHRHTRSLQVDAIIQYGNTYRMIDTYCSIWITHVTHSTGVVLLYYKLRFIIYFITVLPRYLS
jgi:hypothetical protein